MEALRLYYLALTFASLGLICAWLRILYYALPTSEIGPLIIAMFYMVKDVGYFVFILCIAIFGFSVAFEMVYAGVIEANTGFGNSFYTTLLIAYTEWNWPELDQFLPLIYRLSGIFFFYFLRNY
jgi:hypothetical protein